MAWNSFDLIRCKETRVIQNAANRCLAGSALMNWTALERKSVEGTSSIFTTTHVLPSENEKHATAPSHCPYYHPAFKKPYFHCYCAAWPGRQWRRVVFPSKRGWILLLGGQYQIVGPGVPIYLALTWPRSFMFHSIFPTAPERRITLNHGQICNGW